MKHSILVVDDDLLTRELLCLVAAEAGLLAETFDCGEQVLAHLAEPDPGLAAILCDMQMPGIAGAALAQQLRALCASTTVLLAMSGSPLRTASGQPDGFDAFLLKPFSAAQLTEALARKPKEAAQNAAAPGSSRHMVLDETIYASLAKSLPPARLAELYMLCLDDARRRVVLLDAAAAVFDDAAFRSGAHAIKGGAAMVGAIEVAALASEIEAEGLASPFSDPTGPQRILTALFRLERILIDKVARPAAAF